jgi:hypothetical protein
MDLGDKQTDGIPLTRVYIQASRRVTMFRLEKAAPKVSGGAGQSLVAPRARSSWQSRAGMGSGVA